MMVRGDAYGHVLDSVEADGESGEGEECKEDDEGIMAKTMRRGQQR